jgi:uncharacterized membrane protein
MSVTKSNSISQYFIGSLIVSVIGGFSIILGDFAGWDASNYYLGVFVNGWIDVSLENPFSAIILVSAACLLFIASYVSFLGLQNPEQEGLQEKIQYATLGSIGALVILIAGGLLFAIIMLIEDDAYWWFDLGFYGGVIGAGLTITFLYLVKREFTET